MSLNVEHHDKGIVILTIDPSPERNIYEALGLVSRDDTIRSFVSQQAACKNLNNENCCLYESRGTQYRIVLIPSILVGTLCYQKLMFSRYGIDYPGPGQINPLANQAVIRLIECLTREDTKWLSSNLIMVQRLLQTNPDGEIKFLRLAITENTMVLDTVFVPVETKLPEDSDDYFAFALRD